MDPGQILWVAPSPPYLQTFLFFKNFQFSNFYDFFLVFVNTGSYGSKNFQKLLIQFSSDLSQSLWKQCSHWGGKRFKRHGAGVRRRPSIVRRPSVNSAVFQKPLHGSRPNFGVAPSPPYLQTIFLFFQNFNFQIFTILCLFVNIGLYGSKNVKMLFLLQFSSVLSQTLW